MQTNKKVFILLVVLALLFVAGLGTNFFSSKKKENVSTYDRKKSWVSSMDSMMSSFYPKLSPGRLVPADPKCQIEGGAYLLDTERECKFFIKRQDGEKYQNATLKVGGGAKVWLAIPDKTALEDEDKAKCLDDPIANPLEFRVEYLQSGEEADCWMLQDFDEGKSNGTEVRLVVREKGGSLSLTCPNCDQSKGRTVSFEIE